MNSILWLAASFAVLACDSTEPKEAEKKAASAKTPAAASDSKAKADKPAEGSKKDVAPALELVEMDVTEHAKTHLPGFSGTLKMKVPKGAEFGAGVGKMRISKGDFELEVGSGFSVKERKEKLSSGSSYENVKYLDDTEEHILFSAKMFGSSGFFVVSNAPPIGGLKCSCDTGMAGAKTEAVARQVLESCQSIQYEK